MGSLDLIISCRLAFLVVAFEVSLLGSLENGRFWSNPGREELLGDFRDHMGSLDLVISFCLAFLVVAFEVQIPL